MNWKTYYAAVVRTIAILKEKHKFIYRGGNPFYNLKLSELINHLLHLPTD